MNYGLKKIYPHLIALGIFIVLAVVQYFPVFQGKTVHQNDVINYWGMSKESEDYFIRTGKWPLWTNSMFCGMPAYQISTRYPANILSHIYMLINHGLGAGNFMLIALIGFYILLISLKVDWILSIGGAIAYAFSTYFFIIVHVGHNSKTMALALLPPVIAGILLIFRGKRFTGGVLVAVFLGFTLVANHVQMVYYFFIALLIYVLIEFYSSWKEKKLMGFFKDIAVIALAIVVALLSNITGIWMTYEYGKYSTRGKTELSLKKDVKTSGLNKDYATNYSYGISETFNLFIPNFAGSASNTDIGTHSELYNYFAKTNKNSARQLVKKAPTYWGSQPVTDGPFYLGATVCFLFFLGIFLVKGKMKWWLVSAVTVSILLAWGKNFMVLTGLFLDYFPMYNKFRAVASILVIAMFAVPLLGCLGLKKFFDLNTFTPSSKWKKRPPITFLQIKPIVYSLLFTGGTALIMILIGQWLFDFDGLRDNEYKNARWPIDVLKSDRMNMMRSDAFRSLLYAAMMASLLFSYMKKWLKKETAMVLIAGIILCDLWTVGRRYLNGDSFEKLDGNKMLVQPSKANEMILQQETYYHPRINTYADSLAGKYLTWKKSEWGLNNAYLSDDDKMNLRFLAMNKLTNFRVINAASTTFSESHTSYFHKSLGGYHGAKLKRYQELVDYHIAKNNRPVWDMLNAKYFIVKDANENPVAQLNPQALGNAWFVKELKIAENADSEITAMKNFNPAATAIIDKRFSGYLNGLPAPADTTGKISMNEYDLERISYSSGAASEGLAVFSEIFYDKGWNAYIDGKPVPHIRVNYVLRALRIPAGIHKIEFRFEPENYYLCEKISFAGSLLLVVLIFVSMIINFRRFNYRL